MLEASNMTPEFLRVTDAWDEVPGVRSIRLELTKPRGLMPGQFAMLYVPGFGESAISFSRIEPHSVVHTIRDVGRVSHALCNLQPGQSVGWRGPLGTSWPVESAKKRDVVVVAGGLGLAPLRPVIDLLRAKRDQFGTIAVVAGSRNSEAFLFLEEMREIDDLDVFLTVDSGTGGWRGDVGVVTTLLPRLSFDPTKTVAMVCGPEVMMRFAVRELMAMGVASEDVYVSLERNMQCGVGICGHCQFGPYLLCRDGAVMPYADVASYFSRREL